MEAPHRSNAFNQHPQAECCHAHVVDENKSGDIDGLPICHHLLGNGDRNQICTERSCHAHNQTLVGLPSQTVFGAFGDLLVCKVVATTFTRSKKHLVVSVYLTR